MQFLHMEPAVQQSESSTQLKSTLTKLTTQPAKVSTCSRVLTHEYDWTC